MDNAQKRRAVIEMGKNVLIVLLLCSAVWLAVRSQLFIPLTGMFQEDMQPSGPLQSQGGSMAQAARPMRLAVNLPGGAGVARYGVEYDTATSNALFEQVASLLIEVLPGVDGAELVTREQWEQAMATAPGVMLDMQGEVPLSVLAGWLSSEESLPGGTVRRMVLTMWQGSVALYYQDAHSGLYYRCLSQVANQSQLDQMVSALADNRAAFAFEVDAFQGLDGDMLVMERLPELAVYNAANPLAEGRTSLAELVAELGFPVDASSFYPSGSEQVCRSGSDSIRLSNRGIAIYESGAGESPHFVVAARRGEATLFESVEACRQLAAATIGARCGQARLYLISAREGPDGLEVCFGYSLNGVIVQLERDSAARFIVRGGQIVRFELVFRSYTDRGEHCVVMPVAQAIAAMQAVSPDAKQLLLAYDDIGIDMITASWVTDGALAGVE